MTASYDESSQILKTMMAEMPANVPLIKFCWADAESSGELADLFGVESVPSLALCHPAKNDLIASVTPDVLN